MVTTTNITLDSNELYQAVIQFLKIQDVDTENIRLSQMILLDNNGDLGKVPLASFDLEITIINNEE